MTPRGPGGRRPERSGASVADLARLVWRSLPLQAAFNGRTLQGAGFAFALLPLLRRVHGGGAAPRAAGLAAGFNANPYLAPFAIGAVAAAEGSESPQRIDRFLHLVRGPLGSLGDSLFWAAARPAILVPASLAVAAGAPWWIALAALVPFNALAFAARFSGARAGLARGLNVAEALGRSWVRHATAVVRLGGALLIGLSAGLLVGRAAARGMPALAPGGAPGSAEPSAPAWTALLVFALAVALFTLWPRRVGWGVALLALWALGVGLASWTLA